MLSVAQELGMKAPVQLLLANQCRATACTILPVHPPVIWPRDALSKWKGGTGPDSLAPTAPLMISRPFDFKRYPSRDFKVPSWFKHYLPHSEEAVRHWESQYQLAKAGKQHEIPEWSMRSPAGELPRLMSAVFWSEVPKDFSSILDVGCNEGYMVKMFQDEGKKAVGINDSLMPIDWAYIEDCNL